MGELQRVYKSKKKKETWPVILNHRNYFCVSIPTWTSHRLQEPAYEVGEGTEISSVLQIMAADEATIE